MRVARWGLVGMGAVLLALVIANGPDGFATAAGLVVVSAAAVSTAIVYLRVRRQRKARDKAHILQRVAKLDDQHRPAGPVVRG